MDRVNQNLLAIFLIFLVKVFINFRKSQYLIYKAIVIHTWRQNLLVTLTFRIKNYKFWKMIDPKQHTPWNLWRAFVGQQLFHWISIGRGQCSIVIHWLIMSSPRTLLCRVDAEGSLWVLDRQPVVNLLTGDLRWLLLAFTCIAYDVFFGGTWILVEWFLHFASQHYLGWFTSV